MVLNPVASAVNAPYEAQVAKRKKLNNTQTELLAKLADEALKEEIKDAKLNSHEVLNRAKKTRLQSQLDTATSQLKALQSERKVENCDSSWHPVTMYTCYRRRSSLETEIGGTLDRMRTLNQSLRNLDTPSP